MVLLPRDVSDNERASGNGSIADAGTQVASAPGVPRAVFLSHNSRCSLEFSLARGGGRGREARRGLQPGDVRSSLRRAAAGEGAEAMFSSARVGEGEGAGACSSINFGWPGALLGGSVAFGSGCG